MISRIFEFTINRFIIRSKQAIHIGVNFFLRFVNDGISLPKAIFTMSIYGTILLIQRI